MNKHAMQQEIAITVVNHVAQQLSMGLNVFQDGREKVTFCTSVSMVGVAASAIQLTETGSEIAPIPDEDMVLFACLYTANASSFNGEGGLFIEFDIGNVIKTMEQFQQLTGRSYEGRLDKSLMDKVRQGRKNASEAFTGDFSKFRPQ
jgi:hypothetical protein